MFEPAEEDIEILRFWLDGIRHRNWLNLTQDLTGNVQKDLLPSFPNPSFESKESCEYLTLLNQIKTLADLLKIFDSKFSIISTSLSETFEVDVNADHEDKTLMIQHQVKPHCSKFLSKFNANNSWIDHRGIKFAFKTVDYELVKKTKHKTLVLSEVARICELMIVNYPAIMSMYMKTNSPNVSSPHK